MLIVLKLLADGAASRRDESSFFLSKEDTDEPEARRDKSSCGVFNVLKLLADDTASLGDESSFFLRLEDTDEPESRRGESSCGVLIVLKLPADDTRSLTGVMGVNGSFIFPIFSSGFIKDLKISPDVSS